jgi:hypothetical protein
MKNISTQDSDVKRHLKVFHFHTSFEDKLAINFEVPSNAKLKLIFAMLP